MSKVSTKPSTNVAVIMYSFYVGKAGRSGKLLKYRKRDHSGTDFGEIISRLDKTEIYQITIREKK